MSASTHATFENTGESIASDRLRKAIERNRAKAEKRDQSFQQNLSSPKNPSTASVRKRVYTPSDDIEIIGRRTKTKPKTKSRQGFSFGLIHKRKNRSINWLVCLGWCFNFFIFLRLIFSHNGVIDYYSMESTLKSTQHKLESNIIENKNLRNEIKKISTSKRYQKVIAREHLGVISSDEYLVLFAGE